MKPGLIRLAAMLLATSASAQDRLVETLIPEPRPYPYAILDIQPGEHRQDAQSMFEERMMLQLVPEVISFRVQNNEGRSFALSFDQKLVTQGVTLNLRLGREPYAGMLVTLATEAMGSRRYAQKLVTAVIRRRFEVA